jgi:DNA-binding transcriptional MerR regulator
MTVSEPTIADSARLNSSQAARILEMSRETLRKYTDEGLIRCGYRRLGSQSRRRFYSGREIKRFWRVMV